MSTFATYYGSEGVQLNRGTHDTHCPFLVLIVEVLVVFSEGFLQLKSGGFPWDRFNVDGEKEHKFFN